MVRKKYIVNKIIGNENLCEESHYSSPIKSPQSASNRTVCEKGKKQAWIFLLPLIDVAIMDASLIVCYVIGLVRSETHTSPQVPFISEVGSTPPESYVFTFGMTCSSLTTFLIVFFRYKQVSFNNDDYLNSASAVTGNLAALSKLMLGAFQFHPKFKWLHYSAFIGYAFFSYVFNVTQVFLTYYTKTISPVSILFARLVISLLMIIFAVLFFAFQLPQFLSLNEPPYNVAQIAQWIYWTLLNSYTLTFIKDFTRIRVSWNVRNSSHMEVFACEESEQSTQSPDNLHESVYADSDSTSYQLERTYSDESSISICSDFRIPRKYATKV